jgi:hypothetical protein
MPSRLHTGARNQVSIGQSHLAFAADERKSSAIGVILSDIGIDGTLGLEDINAEGDFKYLP